MQDVEAVLLNRVVARPKDMAPRRAYAKWLKEQGDVRGEAIELMLRKKLDKAGQARLQKIFDAASSAIEADIVATGAIAMIERGLVEEVIADPATLVKFGDVWFSRHPIRIVQLSQHKKVSKVRELAACAFLSRIEKLEVDASKSDFSALWTSPHFLSLERLEISAIGVKPHAKSLANLATLRAPKLRTVRLYCVEGADRGYQALCAAKHLSALRTVEIADGQHEVRKKVRAQ
jgi:uncharacterized protein (TIGR02996 family)